MGMTWLELQLQRVGVDDGNKCDITSLPLYQNIIEEVNFHEPQWLGFSMVTLFCIIIVRKLKIYIP